VVVGPSTLARSLAPAAPGGPRRRLGLCVDEASDQAALVPFCADWAKDLELDVEVLTVRAEDDRPISRFHPASRRKLDELVAALAARELEANDVVLKELQPARALAHHAAERDLALLIVAKRTSTDLRRDFLGSTTMNLVHHSPCPVLIPAAHGEVASTGDADELAAAGDHE
jgi:nucleotide-binding universal stress UspA family protein